MDNELYDMIFKRRSVRHYDDNLHLSEKELRMINDKLSTLTPLDNTIGVKFVLKKRTETNVKWGEYCILLYSEEKDNYLMNAGYILEQLDLYFASVNIGACWYGFGKADIKEIDGKKFVIMIAFGKATEDSFKKAPGYAKRFETADVWEGDKTDLIGDTVRLSPSACNSQPWRVKCDGSTMTILRTTEINSLNNEIVSSYFNHIDMGIFLCITELTLQHNGIAFTRRIDDSFGKEKLNFSAEYKFL